MADYTDDISIGISVRDQATGPAQKIAGTMKQLLAAVQKLTSALGAQKDLGIGRAMEVEAARVAAASTKIQKDTHQAFLAQQQLAAKTGGLMGGGGVPPPVMLGAAGKPVVTHGGPPNLGGASAPGSMMLGAAGKPVVTHGGPPNLGGKSAPPPPRNTLVPTGGIHAAPIGPSLAPGYVPYRAPVSAAKPGFFRRMMSADLDHGLTYDIIHGVGIGYLSYSLASPVLGAYSGYADIQHAAMYASMAGGGGRAGASTVYSAMRDVGVRSGVGMQEAAQLAQTMAQRGVNVPQLSDTMGVGLEYAIAAGRQIDAATAFGSLHQATIATGQAATPGNMRDIGGKLLKLEQMSPLSQRDVGTIFSTLGTSVATGRATFEDAASLVAMNMSRGMSASSAATATKAFLNRKVIPSSLRSYKMMREFFGMNDLPVNIWRKLGIGKEGEILDPIQFAQNYKSYFEERYQSAKRLSKAEARQKTLASFKLLMGEQASPVIEQLLTDEGQALFQRYREGVRGSGSETLAELHDVMRRTRKERMLRAGAAGSLFSTGVGRGAAGIFDPVVSLASWASGSPGAVEALGVGSGRLAGTGAIGALVGTSAAGLYVGKKMLEVGGLAMGHTGDGVWKKALGSIVRFTAVVEGATSSLQLLVNAGSASRGTFSDSARTASFMGANAGNALGAGALLSATLGKALGFRNAVGAGFVGLAAGSLADLANSLTLQHIREQDWESRLAGNVAGMVSPQDPSVRFRSRTTQEGLLQRQKMLFGGQSDFISYLMDGGKLSQEATKFLGSSGVRLTGELYRRVVPGDPLDRARGVGPLSHLALTQGAAQAGGWVSNLEILRASIRDPAVSKILQPRISESYGERTVHYAPNALIEGAREVTSATGSKRLVSETQEATWETTGKTPQREFLDKMNKMLDTLVGDGSNRLYGIRADQLFITIEAEDLLQADDVMKVVLDQVQAVAQASGIAIEAKRPQ